MAIYGKRASKLLSLTFALVVTHLSSLFGEPKYRRPYEQCPKPNTCADQMTYYIAYYEAGADILKCHPVPPTALDPTLYTHIHLVGADLSSQFEVTGSRILEPLLPELVALKERNRDLKVVLSVGNFNNSQHTDGCHYFSKVSGSDASRAAFVETAREALTLNNLDGIDLVTGYPESQVCLISDEKANFVKLVKHLRETLDSKYTISMAIPPEQQSHGAFDLARLAPYLNYTVLRAQDKHWDVYSDGLHSTNLTSMHEGVDHLVKQGMPSNKVILEVLAGGPLLALEDPDSAHSRPKAIPLSECTNPKCKLVREIAKGVCVGNIAHPTYRETLLLREHLTDSPKNLFLGDVGFMLFADIGWVARDYTFTIREVQRLAFRQTLGGYSLRALHGDSSNFDLSKALLEVNRRKRQVPSMSPVVEFGGPPASPPANGDMLHTNHSTAILL